MSSSFSPIVGISFGNTSSSIATVKNNDKVEVIANPDGERVIATALSYRDGDEYHGGQAIQQLIRNPKNTIINFRDLIGQPKFSKLSEDLKNRCSAGAPVVDIGDDVPGFIITNSESNKEIKLSVDEVVARHLKNLKLAADDYIGVNNKKAVITVPYDFNDLQKERIAKAASKAGLEIVQFIHEPSAALLSHLTTKTTSIHKDSNVVVADFGGLQSSVTVFAIRNNGIFTKIYTESRQDLGGSKIDDVLLKYLNSEFQKKTKVDATKNPRSLAKLKSNAILTKKTLSNTSNANISIDSLADGLDFNSSINVFKYDLVVRNVINEMVTFVEQAVEKSGLDKLEVDSILLTGGASFTPKITQTLQVVFPENQVKVISLVAGNELQHPDEMLSAGAAVQASLLADDLYEEDDLEKLLGHSVDVPQLNECIGVLDGSKKFVTIFDKYTSLPARQSFKLKSLVDGADLEVYTGKLNIKEEIIEKEEAPKKEEKKEDDDDDDENDWSEDEDDEPEVLKTKEIEPVEKLAELGIKATKNGVELIFEISRENKLKVIARDLKTNEVLQQI
ncbi:related to Ribosome-associated complex subunit SSZ1 [Saccharomycodes ludwigii]|uniref:Related to Ribosome-associated complex subunit SSZ1 n=1 Tax=Saccharomycodes ludwigii TaxID=36035 RepID=A0A376B5C2_9ASCO|nr:related to Ribosome-associated complex subunit SSZ1 [Saccharomycodes ludwigii]